MRPPRRRPTSSPPTLFIFEKQANGDWMILAHEANSQGIPPNKLTSPMPDLRAHTTPRARPAIRSPMRGRRRNGEALGSSLRIGGPCDRLSCHCLTRDRLTCRRLTCHRLTCHRLTWERARNAAKQDGGESDHGELEGEARKSVAVNGDHQRPPSRFLRACRSCMNDVWAGAIPTGLAQKFVQQGRPAT